MKSIRILAALAIGGATFGVTAAGDTTSGGGAFTNRTIRVPSPVCILFGRPR